jgi:hypothetical protein
MMKAVAIIAVVAIGLIALTNGVLEHAPWICQLLGSQICGS